MDAIPCLGGSGRGVAGTGSGLAGYIGCLPDGRLVYVRTTAEKNPIELIHNNTQ